MSCKSCSDTKLRYVTDTYYYHRHLPAERVIIKEFGKPVHLKSRLRFGESLILSKAICQADGILDSHAKITGESNTG